MKSRLFRLLPLLTTILIQFIPAISNALVREVSVKEGHQLVLQTRGIRRIAVGNNNVIRASILDGGDALLIAGLKKGSTDVLLWKQNDIETILVKVTRNTDELPLRDKSDLSSLLEALGVKNPIIRNIQGKTVIYGEADENARPIIETLAAGFKETIWAIKTPEKTKREILYRLRFIEVSRGELKNFGISWPVSESISVSVRNSKTNPFYAQGNFEMFVKNLISTGKARILAEPILVCEENSQASFHAGGQIPIVIINGDTKKVLWKNYGLLLKINPVARSDGEVTTKIEAEVSTLDHSTGTGDVPGIITRKVDTSFTVPLGKTIVLSGLIRKETVKDVSKLPILGSIPILGELFKSRNFRNNQSELIVTITPSLLTDSESNRLKSSINEEYLHIEKDMRIKLLD